MNHEAAIPVEEVVAELVSQQRFQPYPEYRDSGVECLGELPAHWETRRLKTSLSRNDGGVWGDDFDADGTIVLRSTEQTAGGNWQIDAPARRSLSATEKAGARLSVGDLLVTKSSGSELHIGKTTIVTPEVEALDCCFSNFMQRVRCKPSVHPRFVYYILNSEIGREQFVFRSNSTTGLANLNGGIIGNLWLGFPSFDEQQAIAAFLDRETARIDELVAKKQRLLELLAEKRTALISHAVTKGVNLDAPMKDSRIDWLGSIPEHWSVRRIALFATKLTNGFVGPTRDILVPSGLPYIQSLHIKKNSVVFDGKYFVSDGWLRTHEKARLATDDVLVVQTGDIGQVACVPPEFEGAGCHALIIIRPVPTVMRGPFMSLILNSDYGYHSLKRIQTGALHPHLNCTFVREILVPVPPLREQNAILARNAEDLESLRKLREQISHAIDKLREYRSALISAAVTGKIDVRGEV